MADPAAVIGAVAAAVAAALSGGTLYLSGRREQKAWRRDAVIEAMIAFLDASYGRYSERAFDAQVAGEDVERYRRRADESLRAQNSALTRLRLLASNDVVAAAELVQQADSRVTAWFDAPDAARAWDDVNGPRQRARQAFLSAYRDEFGLGRAKDIVSSRTRPR